ncbi:MAG: RNHCP domain-containing protein [Planctomycetota bacterium]
MTLNPQRPRRKPRGISRRRQDDGGFACVHCGFLIPVLAPGTRHRNHCPRCLWSLHLDCVPGDRASSCRGPMEPIAIEARPDGEWAVVHRCRECGEVRSNRVAGDDAELGLLRLALRPLAAPPFPLDRLHTPGP